METIGRAVNALPDPRDTVAEVEQKALQLSALLRELDNRPLALSDALRDELDAVLDQLSCRIAATRALEQTQPELRSAESGAAAL